MALNTPLSTLVVMLKAEVGDSLVAGTQQDATYKQLLAIKQKLLVAEFDFPYMEDQWDVPAPAGSRYLTLPSTDVLGQSYAMEFNRPLKVMRYYNLRYEEIEYGIGPDQYNYRNSDRGESVDPIQRWRWIQYSNPQSPPTVLQKFEVWPINNVEQTIRFYGQRALNPLVVDTDRADVEDLLLVLSVAVEILSRSKQADAPLRLQNAAKRLHQMRSAYAEQRDEPAIFGGRGEWSERRRKIVVGGNFPEGRALLVEDGNTIIP